MKPLLTIIATVFGFIAGLQAMDSEQEQISQEDKRILTPTEKESAHKMWLIKKADEKSLPYIPQEVLSILIDKLHELHLSENPVLRGQLVYKSKTGKKSFKIRDLVKEGKFDLSNRDIFEDTSDYMLITTDPKMFFHFDKNSKKLRILIAPKFLIEDKIKTTAAPFNFIMGKWNDVTAPIGIFYRMDRWDHGDFDFLTHKNLSSISAKNLYKNWRDHAKSSPPCPFDGLNLYIFYYHLLQYCKKLILVL